MGKVIPFPSKEDRRVKDILPLLANYDITALIRMLPSPVGYVFHYHRFGPTITLNKSHYPLVVKEMKRRGLKVEGYRDEQDKDSSSPG